MNLNKHKAREHMKNIEFILFCYKDLIFGKILYTKDDLKGKFMYQYKVSNIEYTIVSMHFPDVISTILYLQGDTGFGDNIISREYMSNEVAISALSAFIKGINDINKMSDEELSCYLTGV